MASRKKHEMREGVRRRARGGAAESAKEAPYNAKGTPAMRSAEDDKGDGFRRGGHVKERQHGGKVEGEKERAGLGKRARGGHVEHESKAHEKAVERRDEHREEVKREHRATGGRVGRGGSPYSSAHSLAAPDRGDAGHQSEMPKGGV